ncbi:MAG: nitrogenase component 1 [Elusimicrobiota bacterium]
MLSDDQAPLNFSALIGVYLGINAISDAYLLVDSTDCSLYKTQYIHGRHDWNSSLLRTDGLHRIAFSNICVQGAVSNHEEPLRAKVRALDRATGAGVVFVTAMPLCSLTCVDYGRMIRETADLTGRAIDIPAESLTGDWLDGYATLLKAAATHLALPKIARDPAKVAIVGHMMDRNEGDQQGNLAEMRRLLTGLGLETASIWLSGGRFAELAQAASAGTIVSLPYGRQAARVLAQRTGAALVETSLPFGLEATERFLRDVAAATGRQDRAEAFIRAELSRVIPRLKWMLPYLFFNRKTLFVGDPHLAEGFSEIAEDLGLRLSACVVTGRAGRKDGPQGKAFPLLHEPGAASEPFRRLLREPVDLAVASTCTMGEMFEEGAPVVELGFPSYWQHSVSNRPFLGFDGFLCFVDRMADALAGRLRHRSMERLEGKSGRLA